MRKGGKKYFLIMRHLPCAQKNFYNQYVGNVSKEDLQSTANAMLNQFGAEEQSEDNENDDQMQVPNDNSIEFLLLASGAVLRFSVFFTFTFFKGPLDCIYIWV